MYASNASVAGVTDEKTLFDTRSEARCHLGDIGDFCLVYVGLWLYAGIVYAGRVYGTEACTDGTSTCSHHGMPMQRQYVARKDLTSTSWGIMLRLLGCLPQGRREVLGRR